MGDKIREIIQKALQNLDLSAQAGIELGDFVVEHPEDLKMGDYSTNVAMALAKKVGMNPKELAEKIVAEIKSDPLRFQHLPLIKGEEGMPEINIAGPGFINFYLSREFFGNEVKSILEKGKDFGKTDLFKDQIWAMEYASPNPNKAMHLGHLRNILTGTAVCRILEKNGAKVIREMVDNNRGIAIAKLMWGYLVGGRKDGKRIEDVKYFTEHIDEWNTPERMGILPDRFVDEFYIKGSTECEDKEVETKVRQLVVDWEMKDKDAWNLWERVLAYAYEGQKKTLKRLGATFDYVWHEHEHYQEGKNFVEQGLRNGIFVKLDDGAILTKLEEYKIPDTIVVKKDGTALYITQDLALTDIKKKKHKANKLIWVIGPEQSLAMQQLFAVCEQLGIGKKEEFVHMPYGYVTIKGQGKMSSRKGNVVYIDDVLDEAKEGAKKIMIDRVAIEIIDVISEKIAFGAVAYSILKAGRNTDTAFDIQQAIAFDGDTGPYLQYAGVRALSLIEKGNSEGIKINSDIPDGWETTTLEKNLYRFPEIVSKAGIDLAPSTVATYLTELASSFNTFYAQGKIVDKTDHTSPYKLALTEAFSIVMKNGLNLLGIEVPEKM